MKSGHTQICRPWLEVGLTFLIGAGAGLAVFVWIVTQSPGWSPFYLDNDGPGVFDAFVAAWPFGQAAILFHHVLPGMGRD